MSNTEKNDDDLLVIQKISLLMRMQDYSYANKL